MRGVCGSTAADLPAEAGTHGEVGFGDRYLPGAGRSRKRRPALIPGPTVDTGSSPANRSNEGRVRLYCYRIAGGGRYPWWGVEGRWLPGAGRSRKRSTRARSQRPTVDTGSSPASRRRDCAPWVPDRSRGRRVGAVQVPGVPGTTTLWPSPQPSPSGRGGCLVVETRTGGLGRPPVLAVSSRC